MFCFEKVSLSAMTFLICELGKSTKPELGACINEAESECTEVCLELPDEIASSISALIILPFGPVPATEARFIPF